MKSVVLCHIYPRLHPDTADQFQKFINHSFPEFVTHPEFHLISYAYMFHSTCSFSQGVVVPIPTFQSFATTNLNATLSAIAHALLVSHRSPTQNHLVGFE